ncbi:hypothetical protein MMC18_006722 [Xylographa bjoerkii]|nr:hypothetical protein [Xylographa bjoerkii]
MSSWTGQLGWSWSVDETEVAGPRAQPAWWSRKATRSQDFQAIPGGLYQEDHTRRIIPGGSYQEDHTRRTIPGGSYQEDYQAIPGVKDIQ